jgi:hypothetical protein
MPSAGIAVTSGTAHLVADSLIPAGSVMGTVAFCLTSDTAVKVTLQDTSSSPVVLGTYYLPAGGGVSSPSLNNEARYQFQTSAGKGLDIVVAAAANVGGHLIYETKPVS